MIWHPVRQLVAARITDILVVTSTQHMGDIVNSLGSGARFGCEFTYRVQEEAGGIAHALSMARGFVGDDRVVVLLGDNVFERAIAPHTQAFSEQAEGARVLLKQVGDPERFGVAALDEQQIVSIEEKPSKPPSDYAVVGCYMYDKSVWSIIEGTAPSGRGELEITDVNNEYARRGTLSYGIVAGGWSDAGTFESLSEASAMMLSTQNRVIS